MKHTLASFEHATSFRDGRSVLIFDHIRKCAGTTLRKMLAREFESSFHIANVPQAWLQLKDELKTCASANLAIAGHAAWGIHELLPEAYTAFYVTVLRNPLDRALSTHRFRKSLYSPVRSLSDFLETYPNNFLVHRLGNGSLERSKERLESSYFMFGIVEQFDAFVSLLYSRLGIPLPPYTTENATMKTDPDCDATLIRRFQEQNSLDFELYHWAAAVFERRINEYRRRVFHDTAPCAARPAGVTSHLVPDTAAIALLDQHRYAEAGALIETQTDIDVDRHLSPYLASIYTLAGLEESAEHQLTRAMHHDATRVFAAAEHYRPKDPARAAEVLSSTLLAYGQIESTIPDSFLNRFRQQIMLSLADLQKELKAPGEEKRLLRIAYELDPSTWRALVSFARIKASAGDTTGAFTLLKPAILAPEQFGVTLSDVVRELSQLCSLFAPNDPAMARDLLETHVRNEWTVLAGQGRGFRHVAVFGAGAHTDWLETITSGTVGPAVTAVLDDTPENKRPHWNLQPIRPDTLDMDQVDAIVLSTDTIPDLMRRRCAELFGNSMKTVYLYEGLPPGPYPKNTSLTREHSTQ